MTAQDAKKGQETNSNQIKIKMADLFALFSKSSAWPTIQVNFYFFEFLEIIY
jgi:hypothetical protein